MYTYIHIYKYVHTNVLSFKIMFLIVASCAEENIFLLIKVFLTSSMNQDGIEIINILTVHKQVAMN